MIKILILTGCLLTAILQGQAQQDTIEPMLAEKPLAFAEKMPAFKGGQEMMYAFMSRHIQYPLVARENNIQGTVVVQFVVDVDSLLKEIAIVRSIGGGCDGEVLRLMQLMNEEKTWIPGMHEGKNVPVTFTLPVKFLLTEEKKKKGKRARD